MLNATRQFLDDMRDFSTHEIPSEVISRSKESLLDYIGVTYAGIKELGQRGQNLVSYADGGSALAVGLGSGFAMKDAVFLNGINAHALDFDDGVNAGIIHLGSPVFSLLLPLAKKHGIDGRTLLESAILGYEAAWSLAISIQPTHKRRGYHATGTCGMLGAVVAACHMLDLDEEMTYQAFSIACLSASGMLAVLDDASQLKPYNVAKASLMGLTSVQMAQAGFKGPDDALGGERGFLALMVGNRDIELSKPLRDGRYAILRTYTKPYAACRYCHPSIEAAITLGAELGAGVESVTGVQVKTYDLAVAKHDHTDIQGVGSAKMSIPYGVATGMLRGKAGLAEYTLEAVSDESVLALAKKVTVADDKDMSDAFPSKTVAEVTVSTADGTTLSETVEFPKGEPENPMDREGVCAKFTELVSFAGLDADVASKMIEKTFDVEASLPELLDLLEVAS